MQDVLMDSPTGEHAPFANRRTCQAFQHTNKEQRAKATSSEPTAIEDPAHFAMWRWSWHHGDIHHLATLQLDMHTTSSTNVLALSCRVLSWVMSYTSLPWAILSNQCNVTWKSKRPTCYMKSHVKSKSHGSQTVMRVVEQPQGVSFTLDYKYSLICTCKGLFTLAPPT